MYEDGKLFLERNYSDGELNGKETAYYKNGNVASESFYYDGKVSGTYIANYPSGKIKQRGQFDLVRDTSKAVGVWTSFYENGKKSREGRYAEDQPAIADSVHVETDEEDTEFIIFNSFYAKDGIWHYFKDNGEYDYSVLYKDGKEYTSAWDR